MAHAAPQPTACRTDPPHREARRAHRTDRGSATVEAVLAFPALMLALMMIVQYVLASGGFFQNTHALPPRMFLFGFAPALGLIALAFLVARKSFVSALPIALLMIVHVIRIPVELTLSWLSQAGAVPEVMTYHGTNFDIISGVTAPLAFYFALKNTSGPALRTSSIRWRALTNGRRATTSRVGPSMNEG